MEPKPEALAVGDLVVCLNAPDMIGVVVVVKPIYASRPTLYDPRYWRIEVDIDGEIHPFRAFQLRKVE